MKIDLGNIVIRAFTKNDASALYDIVREKDIVRFMKDFSENRHSPKDYNKFIDGSQSQQDSTNIYENRRYAIALSDTDEMIGMVGMGLEETLNEVEIAYFMSEKFQRKGYSKLAITAIADWCFAVSDINYLILTIDCANTPSCKLAEKCGFELYEKRTPIGHIQPNMESDSYFYYRRYREATQNRGD